MKWKIKLYNSGTVYYQTHLAKDIKDAREAFSCSSTTFILPVVEIDDCKIGDGYPGEHTLRLRRLYINNVKKELI